MRTRHPRPSKKIITIVVEGDTEKHYFDRCKAKFNERQRDREMQVVAANGGSFAQIAGKAIEKAESNASDDEVWCVVDMDTFSTGRPKNERQFDKARKAGVKFLMSNPCFEVWYLCHFEGGDSHGRIESGAEAKKMVERLMPNQKPRDHFGDLKNQLPKAIQSAKKIKKAHEDERGKDKACGRDCNRWTDVHEFIEAMSLNQNVS